MNTDETITIYDVAREAGVSMATVSRVVNGNKNVKENISIVGLLYGIGVIAGIILELFL